MYKKLILFTLVAGISCWAQPNGRRAAITGGGDRDRGHCTVSVMVDGAANIEIRGDDAMMRDVSGAEPQWRRFECTSAIPPGADVRFRAMDGRGTQQMLRNSREGGAAVVHIEDPQPGADTYTFELSWGREGFDQGFDRGNGRQVNDQGERGQFYRDRDEAFRGDWHARLFERVRQDLDHAQAGTFPIGTDEFRLVRTKQELNQLQSAWTSGNFDRHDLDDVINAMQRVVADNRLSGRDRDMLNDDLNRLREFRDRNGWRN
ncbi:MAG TPA: hypothetical protein VKS01_09900 [Bryobacteraceae bacterium]|nr:hypothetical protein [Bryobacteraceae bacterium]